MPRQKTPEGKTVAWTAKLSETEAAAAEALIAEHGLTRSAWLGNLVRAALIARADRRGPIPPGALEKFAPVGGHGSANAAIGLMQVIDSAAQEPPKRSTRKGEQCGHRNWGRYCGGCGRLVGKDGYPTAAV